MSLIKELEIEEKSFITMVGGGGKTTGMFLLAKLLGNSLITSTTKLYKPPITEGIVPVKWPEYNTQQPNSIPLVYSEKEGEKYLGISSEEVEKMWSKSSYDHFLCEGDGARMKPLKVWKGGEPVIPPSTTHTLINIGAKVLGKTWNENWVHRWERFPFEGEKIDLNTIIKMGEQDVFNFPKPTSSKLYLVFNQWDMVENMPSSTLEGFTVKLKEVVPTIDKVLFVSYGKNTVYYAN